MEEDLNPGVMGKAIIASIVGFFFLSMVGVFVKLQASAGVTIQWIVFVQYGICLLITTILASKNKFRDLKTKKFPLHLIRGVTGVLAFTCCAIAITKIPLVNATLLNNTAPLFIPFITLLWLKQGMDEKIWWGILVGFIGIILILRPNAADLIKEGDLYGLAAGFLLAIAYVSLKILTKTESFVTVFFYYSMIAFVLSVPFAITNWSNPPVHVWIYGILTGICFMTYLYLIQYAYRFVEAVKLSPFNYSVIVFTGIFDWLIFNHVPDVFSIMGIILVSLGGILAITLHEKKNEKLKHSIHG